MSLNEGVECAAISLIERFIGKAGLPPSSAILSSILFAISNNEMLGLIISLANSFTFFAISPACFSFSISNSRFSFSERDSLFLFCVNASVCDLLKEVFLRSRGFAPPYCFSVMFFMRKLSLNIVRLRQGSFNFSFFRQVVEYFFTVRFSDADKIVFEF